MKKSKFTEEQIAFALKQAELGSCGDCVRDDLRYLNGRDWRGVMSNNFPLLLDSGHNPGHAVHADTTFPTKVHKPGKHHKMGRDPDGHHLFLENRHTPRGHGFEIALDFLNALIEARLTPEELSVRRVERRQLSPVTAFERPGPSSLQRFHQLSRLVIGFHEVRFRYQRS